LDASPTGEVLATPGLVFSHVDSVIPDIVFFTHERAKLILSGERIIAAPDLIVEIVSPGGENARRDRVIKRQLYAKFGVREYWIADYQSRTVEVFTLKDGVLTESVTFHEDDDLTSAVLPGFRIKVSQIFASKRRSVRIPRTQACLRRLKDQGTHRRAAERAQRRLLFESGSANRMPAMPVLSDYLYLEICAKIMNNALERGPAPISSALLLFSSAP